jgi:hypothetical protein
VANRKNRARRDDRQDVQFPDMIDGGTAAPGLECTGGAADLKMTTTGDSEAAK